MMQIFLFFQYPPCGSSRCNPFVSTSSQLLIGFQYPPCGSSRCNTLSRQPGMLFYKSFQYPPCGSSRCNKGKLEHKRNIDVSFSTLHAGRVAATRASVMAAHSPCLSV